MGFRVTLHAAARYSLQHPDAGPDELMTALQRAQEIPSGAALPLVGRNSARRTSSRYFLAEDRLGLFVIEDHWGMPVVVTYLRFGPWQTQFSTRLWPVEPKPAPGAIPARDGDPRLGDDAQHADGDESAPRSAEQ